MVLQAASRRPLGCWKNVLRQCRQQRQIFARTMATETTPPSSGNAAPTDAAAEVAPPITSVPLLGPNIRIHARGVPSPTKPIRMAFATYPQVPSARATNPSALAAFHAQQIGRLDRSGARTALFNKANRDRAKPGDVLQVTTKKGDPFSGVLIQVRRAGVDSAILLRNRLTKVGVEMWYKIYSPSVVGIEVIWRRPKRARRARLMYMRQAKHDMGNVDHLVVAWRKSRNVFTSRGKAQANKAKAAPKKKF